MEGSIKILVPHWWWEIRGMEDVLVLDVSLNEIGDDYLRVEDELMWVEEYMERCEYALRHARKVGYLNLNRYSMQGPSAVIARKK